MEIGAASGVDADSLLFAFDAIVSNTSLSSAKLKAEIIPFILHCRECGRDSESDMGFMICNHCGSVNVSILTGAALILKQIELHDQ
jgi:hydrogenase nickel incorporation protein HypA/HybF